MKNKPEYFKKLFFEYHTPLCIYAYQYVADHDAAKDIVQDVFHDLWIGFDALDLSYTLKPLLYKYTRNKAVDYLKKTAGKKHSPSGIAELSAGDRIKHLLTEETERELDFRELSNFIQKCVDRLPPQCRNIYTMSRGRGLKNREISESLGISVKAVEKQLSKALNIIKTSLIDGGFIMSLSASIFVANLF